MALTSAPGLVVSGTPWVNASAANRMNASRKFMAGPATSVAARASLDAEAKLPGSVGSSSPRIRQNPPNGMALIE